MSNWRQFAERVRRESEGRDNRDKWDVSPSPEPIGPIVPNVPLDPARALKLWRAGLASVDPTRPPAGIDRMRWHNLCDDAAFIFRTFGETAAREGWSAADLFGLWPDKPGWGGIADRLRGSRSLVMTADRAHWRSVLGGVVERFNRGSYPELRPFWEAE